MIKIFCIIFLFCCCNKISDKEEFKGESIYFVLRFKVEIYRVKENLIIGVGDSWYMVFVKINESW